jgi:hypothetical protein
MRKALILLALVAGVATASAQTRYNGVWTVSRGAGGLARVFVDGKNVTGVLLDSGWQQMTGDPRAGTVTGTIDGNKGTVTVSWSTGQSVEFRGTVSRQRDGLSMAMTRFVNGKEQPNTAFELQAHTVGKPFAEPFGPVAQVDLEQVRGSWFGSFVYGKNDGMAQLTAKADGQIVGTMAVDQEKGRVWTFTGAVSTRSDDVTLTVDSGTSKQTYTGRIRSWGPDHVQVVFDRQDGRFTLTLTRW